jgi:hypothetical protein
MTAFHIGYGDLSHTVFRSFRVETESSNLLFVAEGFDAQKWGVFFKPTSGGWVWTTGTPVRSGGIERLEELVANGLHVLQWRSPTLRDGDVDTFEWLGPIGDAMRGSILWLFDGYLRGKSMISHEIFWGISSIFIHFRQLPCNLSWYFSMCQ